MLQESRYNDNGKKLEKITYVVQCFERKLEYEIDIIIIQLGNFFKYFHTVKSGILYENAPRWNVTLVKISNAFQFFRSSIVKLSELWRRFLLNRKY